MTRFHTLLATAVLAAIGTPLALHAQTYVYTPGYYAAPAPVYQAPQPVALSDQQLDQLLGPIALYPDPLLTQVLAAATYPQDVTAAAQWIQSFPGASEDDINAQPWDPSVKAIVHYPSVLQMMASQPDWTATLGATFASQQQQVMDSIQRLRAEAVRANTLVASPQEQIVNDGGYVQILPTQPNVVYVPSYDPDVVYVGSPGYNQPYITYGIGYPVGGWLDLGWDWRDHRVDRGYHWGRDWRHPDIGHIAPWQHNAGRPLPRAHFPTERPHGVDFRPGEQGGGRNSAFDPRVPSRNGNRGNAPRPPERPVNGLGDHRNVPAPRETPREAPRETPREAPHEAPHPAPQAPAPPVYRAPERPIPGNTHDAPRAVERPVQGLNRSAPAPSAPRAPEPAPKPAPAPAPVLHAAPSPAPSGGAFHPGGGGVAVQSSRGNSSMGGGGGDSHGGGHGGGGRR